MYLLAALGVLIPIGVFIAASTRIGASTRERRFAALRLVGATPQQVAFAAALEAALAGVFGGVLGVILALALRTRAADFGIAGYSAFPADLSPPLWQVGLIFVATPVLAAAAALGSMRRVVVTPLGVRRRQPPGTPSARRLIPLVLSWVELALAVQIGDGLGENGKLAALGLGFAGVILGIVIAGPWLVGALAAGVARAARGPGTLIAGRRLQAAPGTAFRAVGGAVLGVFAATAVLVYLPSHDRWVARGDQVAAYVAPPPVDATVDVYRNGAPAARSDALGARLAATPGVREAVPGAMLEFARAGYGATAVFATCSDARRVLHERSACPAHGVLVSRATQLHVGDRLRIRGVRATVGGFLPNSAVSAVVPPGVVGAAAPPRDMAAADERQPRHRSAGTGRADGERPAGRRRRPPPTTPCPRPRSDPLRRQAELVVALMLSIAGCSLVVMMIEGIVERRRELAMLAAAGTRPRDLRSSVALEIVIPLAVASIASCVIGVVVTATLLRVRGIGLVVPWTSLAQLLAVTVVVGAAVLALGLPMLGSRHPGRQPEDGVGMSVPHALLGLLETGPRHGYDLKREYDARFSHARPLKYGQIYSTLARLQRDGLVMMDAEEPGRGPDRKRYVITEEGATELGRWLSRDRDSRAVPALDAVREGRARAAARPRPRDLPRRPARPSHAAHAGADGAQADGRGRRSAPGRQRALPPRGRPALDRHHRRPPRRPADRRAGG